MKYIELNSTAAQLRGVLKQLKYLFLYFCLINVANEICIDCEESIGIRQRRSNDRRYDVENVCSRRYKERGRFVRRRQYLFWTPTRCSVWKPISSDLTDDLLPEIQNDLFRKRLLVDYLRKNTGEILANHICSTSFLGWNMTVSDLGDVADNIDQMNKFHEVNYDFCLSQMFK